ncbi:MAG: alpha/beta hydrolase [Sphingobacteriaceae bacterium]|nr:alpha/beta hydrolase [Sphingobacteriaceae bacterium]
MLRLVFLLLLLLLSLLTVFKAFTYHLWLAAVLVTEFPAVFILISAIFLIWGSREANYQIPGTVAGVIAILLFCSPVVRSYYAGMNLENDLDKAFGASSKKQNSVFSAARMLRGSGQKEIRPQTHTYIAYPEKNLTLDFYTSALSGKRACVVVVHGGSWKSGDNKQLPELNTYLAHAGYHVAAINYRLAPKYQSPSAVNDVRKALDYLRKHSGQLRIDTNNFVLLGRSAGAQIALLAAYTLHDRGIKGVIDFYGPADMVWGYSVPSNPLVMNSRKVMEDYLGGTYTEVPENYRNSSPIEFVSKTSVPTLIIHGENDVLVAYEHSRRLHSKLNRLGVKNYFLSLPWATHGFDYTIKGPGGQLSAFAVVVFLKKL